MDPLDADDLALVRSAAQLERQFADNNYDGNATGPGLIEIRGDIPIILSSPHAVNHPREGRLKLADLFTGTLAIQLASLTGASALIYARTSQEDPNYDADGLYKQQLVTLIKDIHACFILDLHGMDQSRSLDVGIGTSFGKTLGLRTEFLAIFTQILEESGFTKMVVDDLHQFNAARPTTIASFVWRETKTPALQLEIHKKYRNVEEAPSDYLKMLYTLRRILYAIQKIL